MELPLDDAELARRLRVELAAYDPAKAEEALDALAEFLVAAYLRRRARGSVHEADDGVAGLFGIS